jgi:hypothetical protein
MDDTAKAMRDLFDRLIEGFRFEVTERRGRGETEAEMDALLHDAEKSMIATGWDYETRILVMERMRDAVREVYRAG